MKRLPTVLLLTALVACGDPGSDASDAPPAAEPVRSLSEQIAVDQVAIYQGVKVTLVDAGERVEKPNAPVVPERPALVRVYAKGLVHRLKLRLLGELRVHVAGRPDLVVKDDGIKTIRPFDDADLTSTFDFELPAGAVATGATFDVTIHDEAAPESIVRYPADGAPLTMNVGELAPTLRVKFVPIRYDADGSGREPDMSQATLDDYKSTLYRLYPTTKVEVGVRDPLRWPLQVGPLGDGWDALLDAVIQTRSDDAVEDDVYYVAVFDPTDSARDWCKDGGCVLGVAPQARRWDVYLRVAMITGFSGNEDTLAQELGHAMGRAHAPCGGAQAVDPKYPYGRANIGVWGWDIVEKTLIDPSDRVYDFMGYCHPTWVSDYTFAGLYERMLQVAESKRDDAIPTGGAGGSESASEMVQISRVLPDGRVRPGARVRARDVDPSSLGFRSVAGLEGGLRIDRVAR